MQNETLDLDQLFEVAKRFAERLYVNAGEPIGQSEIGLGWIEVLNAAEFSNP